MTWNRPINDDLIRLHRLAETYLWLTEEMTPDEEMKEFHEAMVSSIKGEIEWLGQNVGATLKALRERGGKI